MVLHRLLLALLIPAAIAAAPAVAASLQEQRATFLMAEQALDRGDMAGFRRLSDSVRDYPLYPYLEYEALLKSLDQAGNRQVSDFLETYRSTPLAWRLRARWLDQLAKQKRWSDYLAFYEPSKSIDRRCDHLHALIATGKAEQAFPQVAEIWLYGKSRPSACDPVFDAWSKAGHRTTDMNWQRIEKAMEAGEWRLAEYLGRDLSEADQVWIKRWVKLYRTPARAGDPDGASANLIPTVRRCCHMPCVAWPAGTGRRPRAVADDQAALSLQRGPDPGYEQYIVRNLARTPGDAAYDFIRGVNVGETTCLRKRRGFGQHCCARTGRGCCAG